MSLAASCDSGRNLNDEMTSLLSEVYEKNYTHKNPFCSNAKREFFSNPQGMPTERKDFTTKQARLASAFLELGNEQEAIIILEDILAVSPRHDGFRNHVLKTLAIANMRLGERMNCINNHSGESCIFPIAGKGIHSDKTGSQRAIELFEEILNKDPHDLESRWLLNIAYMTTDGYPDKVPPAYLIKELDSGTSDEVRPFIDMAINTGLNTNNMAGGSIVEDFNNDGRLDIVTSSWDLQQGMHYCQNNADGTFADVSEFSGLSELKGGLNIMQTDYNNDGLKDIFVLRGAWMGKYGKQPNSLLKNNGDGTFTDVTHKSGILSLHPTQTATWADFNNDGWLDVFIGNESERGGEPHPCELYVNNRNGTFTEIAANAKCNIQMFVKGVTSGDYDHDGLPDIFLSTLTGEKVLLKNQTKKGGPIKFSNVTERAGLHKNTTRTFPTWFWDYDNDGWLDILVCGYEFNRSLAWYAAKEALGEDAGNSGKTFLFRNNHDGTFEDVSRKSGLDKIAFAMGGNFGDIDNDGYLDIYLGTGNPRFQSLVPNKMFKSKEGKKFVDVTTSARVGNLQKGHGVSIADLDNDGDQDIYIDMGGAFTGDAYQNSLYINPGQNGNNWINFSLEGTKSNKAAIGAKIKVIFEESGVSRLVYREINSGGSFGANPLLQHVGIGQATMITRVEIQWPSGNRQVFSKIQPNRTHFIKEGSDEVKTVTYPKVDFTTARAGLIGCSPAGIRYDRRQ